MPNLNFFMNVPIDPSGNFTVVDGVTKPGDYVELVAEMDVLCLISNCPQVNNPCNGFFPTPIQGRPSCSGWHSVETSRLETPEVKLLPAVFELVNVADDFCVRAGVNHSRRCPQRRKLLISDTLPSRNVSSTETDLVEAGIFI